MNIIANKKWFLLVSALLVTAALVSIFTFKFKLGIDFKSGTLWQIRIAKGGEADLKNILTSKLGVENPAITFDGATNSYSILLPEINEETKQTYLAELQKDFGPVESLDYSSVSPTVSNELKQKSIWVVLFVLLIIGGFVAYAFSSVSWPVSSYKYGAVTLIALAHDTIIASGFYSLMGHFKDVAIDTNFIVALLTIIGFSVYDTIVVLDRVRENLKKDRSGKEDFGKVVNESLNETFERSLNTSITVMLMLVAIWLLGPVSIKYFSLTMLVGMFFGTYSSIFVASPLLVLWHQLDTRKK
ncbi:MAG: protein translocase subunit SecF [Patescibacteria group bacterium]|nr:protein translocase subunit SecF [Patescibacteria group bacterium]MCL5261734.1 protein translocase subunit SecF [Patescibacteria group bacterium]